MDLSYMSHQVIMLGAVLKRSYYIKTYPVHAPSVCACHALSHPPHLTVTKLSRYPDAAAGWSCGSGCKGRGCHTLLSTLPVRVTQSTSSAAALWHGASKFLARDNRGQLKRIQVSNTVERRTEPYGAQQLSEHRHSKGGWGRQAARS